LIFRAKKEREEGGERRFLKKDSSCIEIGSGAAEKKRVGRDPRGLGRTKQKLRSNGKGASQEKGASRGKYRCREYELECMWLVFFCLLIHVHVCVKSRCDIHLQCVCVI